jgi:Zn-dependent protease with chaperone function
MTATDRRFPGTGQSVVQVFLHSVSAAVISQRAIANWNIRSPAIRQKFHLIAVFAPVVSYPLYQWINPDRGSVNFRLGALFDSERWINVELWNLLPVGLLFLLVLVASTAVFMFQELIPILRHRSGPSDPASAAVPAETGSPVALAAEGLADEPPEILVVEDDDPAIHSVVGGSPVIYVTTGLVQGLQPAELRAAIAHEVAHVRRSRRPLLMVAYVVRVLQFFSVGTLVAFRRAAAEEEKICDDWAVEATGRPDALAAVLEKLRHSDAFELESSEEGEVLSSIEHMSYDLMVQERIRRLADGESTPTGTGDWSKFAVTAAAIAILNYFIV